MDTNTNANVNGNAMETEMTFGGAGDGLEIEDDADHEPKDADPDLDHHLYHPPLLYESLAYGVSAVAQTARLGISATSAVAEIALSTARWGTALTLGLGRTIMVGALNSARVLHRTARSPVQSSSQELIHRPENLALFHQALDHYTDYTVNTVNHVFSLAELFTYGTWHLARTSVRFSLKAATETVNIFDGLFGSTETSRALSALVSLIREELTELNNGEGVLPGKGGMLGKSLASIALMGGLTKALTAFACLQLVTARRTLASRKMTRLYEGLVRLDNRSGGSGSNTPLLLTAGPEVKMITMDGEPGSDEEAKAGLESFDHPMQVDFDEETLIRWHRGSGEGENLLIHVEDDGDGVNGDPMITFDDTKSFIEEAQKIQGEDIEVIDNAQAFLEDSLSSDSAASSIHLANQDDMDNEELEVAIVSEELGCGDSPGGEEGITFFAKSGTHVTTATATSKLPAGNTVGSPTTPTSPKLNIPPPVIPRAKPATARIATEDQMLLNRLSRDFSGKDLAQLEKAISSAGNRQGPGPWFGTVGSMSASSQSSSSSTVKPSTAPGSRETTYGEVTPPDTPRSSESASSQDGSVSSASTARPTKVWGGFVTHRRAVGKPNLASSPSDGSGAGAGGLGIVTTPPGSPPTTRKKPSFNTAFGGMFKAFGGVKGKQKDGHEVGDGARTRTGMVTMFDETSTVQQLPDGTTMRQSTIRVDSDISLENKDLPVPPKADDAMEVDSPSTPMESTPTPTPPPLPYRPPVDDPSADASSPASPRSLSPNGTTKVGSPPRRKGKEISTGATKPAPVRNYPFPHLVQNLERYCRFSSAAYATAAVGAPPSPTMQPLIHYVALDREASVVVVALRGTLGLSDLLTDLRFDYVAFKGHLAHSGMLRTAKQMCRKGSGLMDAIAKALTENPTFGLTGHSLGAGVASLCALELSCPASSPPPQDINGKTYEPSPTPFLTSPTSGLPPGRPIHCYAYGSPCVVSYELSVSAKGLVSTLIHGDDIVPTISLGLVKDFKTVTMHLLDPANRGLSERIISKTLGFGKSGPAGPGLGVDLAGDANGGASGLNYGAGSGSVPGSGTPGNGDVNVSESAPASTDEEYFWGIISQLRQSMKHDRLYVAGTTYWANAAVTVARDAFNKTQSSTSRVSLQRCDDIRDMFNEPRFSSRVISDHTPVAYEAALEALLKAVMSKKSG
ncbi:hypothetical protein HDU76_003364 [Blyttiomyces sp. JEL0837]|nr:hypothetical protein HDU76_003364 [Blyttiomyces sp. JEL0837]